MTDRYDDLLEEQQPQLKLPEDEPAAAEGTTSGGTSEDPDCTPINSLSGQSKACLPSIGADGVDHYRAQRQSKQPPSPYLITVGEEQRLKLAGITLPLNSTELTGWSSKQPPFARVFMLGYQLSGAIAILAALSVAFNVTAPAPLISAMIGVLYILFLVYNYLLHRVLSAATEKRFPVSATKSTLLMAIGINPGLVLQITTFVAAAVLNNLSGKLIQTSGSSLFAFLLTIGIPFSILALFIVIFRIQYNQWRRVANFLIVNHPAKPRHISQFPAMLLGSCFSIWQYGSIAVMGTAERGQSFITPLMNSETAMANLAWAVLFFVLFMVHKRVLIPVQEALIGDDQQTNDDERSPHH